MSKDIRKDIKKCIAEMTSTLSAANKSNLKLAEDFHYLIDNNAAEELGCKETALYKQIKCDKRSRSTLHRLQTQAFVEHDMGLPPNTLLECWTREMNITANNLNLTDTAREEFFLQIWKISKRNAGGSTKVSMKHIRTAIEYSTSLIVTEDDPQATKDETDSSKAIKNPTAETEPDKDRVVNLLTKIKQPSLKMKIKTIRNVLVGKDELYSVIKDLTLLSELERNDLHSLMLSDKKLSSALNPKRK